tara:strand:- start:116 stop:373 length:258 start_codon:yes stop_codon:yes gene_type:complete
MARAFIDYVKLQSAAEEMFPNPAFVSVVVCRYRANSPTRIYGRDKKGGYKPLGFRCTVYLMVFEGFTSNLNPNYTHKQMKVILQI